MILCVYIIHHLSIRNMFKISSHTHHGEYMLQNRHHRNQPGTSIVQCVCIYKLLVKEENPRRAIQRSWNS